MQGSNGRVTPTLGTAAQNDDPSTGTAQPRAKASKKQSKAMTAAFNMASGAAVAMAIKGLTVTCLATMASPVAITFIGAAAAGLGTSYLRHAVDKYQQRKNLEDVLARISQLAEIGKNDRAKDLLQNLHSNKNNLQGSTASALYNLLHYGSEGIPKNPELAQELKSAIAKSQTKFTLKKALLGAGFGVVGAGVIQGIDAFAPNLFSNIFSGIRDFFGFSAGCATPAAAATVPPMVDSVPTPAPDTALSDLMQTPADESVLSSGDNLTCDNCTDTPAAPVEQPAVTVDTLPATPMNAISEMAKGENVTRLVHDTIEKAASNSADVAAQAKKDLAIFVLDGKEGLAKNAEMAVQLLQEAAGQGNVQAQIDMAYLEYHGKAGLNADPAAALEKMKAINTEAARNFVAQWTGVGKAAEMAVDTVKDTIAPVAPDVVLPEAPVPQVESIATVDGPATVQDTTVIHEEFAEVASMATHAMTIGNMACKALIEVGGDNAISYECETGVDDTTFAVGDRVTIQRPGIIPLFR